MTREEKSAPGAQRHKLHRNKPKGEIGLESRLFTCHSPKEKTVAKGSL